MNLKQIFGDVSIAKMLIMKKAWDLIKTLRLSKSEALKQAYNFYNEIRPIKPKKIKFDLSSFVTSNNQIEYVESCNQNTLKKSAWQQIATSGRMSDAFIIRYLDEIYSNVRLISDINQQLSEKVLINLLANNIKRGKWILSDQFYRYHFEEKFICDVLNTIQQDCGKHDIEFLLHAIYLGNSTLSQDFYFKYQDFEFTNNKQTMEIILAERGHGIPYQFLQAQQKYVSIDQEILEYYCNYKEKYSAWLLKENGISVKKSARRTVFVLNREGRETA